MTAVIDFQATAICAKSYSIKEIIYGILPVNMGNLRRIFSLEGKATPMLPAV